MVQISRSISESPLEITKSTVIVVLVVNIFFTFLFLLKDKSEVRWRSSQPDILKLNKLKWNLSQLIFLFLLTYLVERTKFKKLLISVGIRCKKEKCVLNWKKKMNKVEEHWTYPRYFENQIPLKPVIAGWGVGGGYAASQTTMLHMKRHNNTESPIFVISCSLFPKAILFDFYVEKSLNTSVRRACPRKKFMTLIKPLGWVFFLKARRRNGFELRRGREIGLWTVWAP